MKDALRRKIHSSWLIGAGMAGVVVGSALTQYTTPEQLVSPAWLVAGILVFGACIVVRRAWCVTVIVIAGCLVGLWRGSVERLALQNYEPLYDKHITITGSISEDPEKNKAGVTVLRLNHSRYQNENLNGVIWVTVTSNNSLKRGDVVTTRGTLEKGFGTFAAVMYRADVVDVSRYEIGDVAGRFRDWFADQIRQVIPSPQADLGIGFLVGQRSTLPSDLDDALVAAGLTHIVVASGYNLTILVRLARRLFAKISKYVSFLAASGMITAFVLVAGGSPSMSRAGLVAGLSLLAWYYGRKFHPLVLLSFAAGITVIIEPSYSWGDIGWLLSFTAFFGVMVVAPLLQSYFFGNKQPGVLRQIIGETLSAQICTLPILVVAFGQFSLVAPVANLLVLPLVPAAMLMTFFAGAAAVVWPVLGMVLAPVATSLLSYMISVAYQTANLPWSTQEVALPVWGGLVSYVLIGILCVYLQRASGYNLRTSSLVE